MIGSMMWILAAASSSTRPMTGLSALIDGDKGAMTFCSDVCSCDDATCSTSDVWCCWSSTVISMAWDDADAPAGAAILLKMLLRCWRCSIKMNRCSWCCWCWRCPSWCRCSTDASQDAWCDHWWSSLCCGGVWCSQRFWWQLALKMQAQMRGKSEQDKRGSGYDDCLVVMFPDGHNCCLMWWRRMSSVISSPPSFSSLTLPGEDVLLLHGHDGDDDNDCSDDNDNPLSDEYPSCGHGADDSSWESTGVGPTSLRHALCRPDWTELDSPQGLCATTSTPVDPQGSSSSDLWHLRALHCSSVEVPLHACAVCHRQGQSDWPVHCMMCSRRINPRRAPSVRDYVHPILRRFCCTSSRLRGQRFRFHSVKMRHSCATSGCAEAVAATSADDTSVVSVSSSVKDRSVVESGPIPCEEPSSPDFQVPAIPARDGHPMVCAMAHRSSHTPPWIVLDIHRPDHKLDHGVPDPKCDIRLWKRPGRYLFWPLTSQGRTPQLCTRHGSCWCLYGVWKEVRLVWAMGVENRDDPHVVAGLQCGFERLDAPVLRLHSDRLRSFSLRASGPCWEPMASGRQQTRDMIRQLMGSLKDGLASSLLL